MSVLVLNSGSSSIKFGVYSRRHGGEPQLQCRGEIEGMGGGVRRFFARAANGRTLIDGEPQRASNHAEALAELLAWLQQRPGMDALLAAGHRVVHGGQDFTEPLRIDAQILEQLQQLVPLAPLHQPHNLAAIRALAERYPSLPQIACFDTAFHAGQPSVARQFALPRRLTEAGILRYGFHGLSYSYIATRLPQVTGSARGQVVVAHLGNGASMCALSDGRSQATSMGFTALDGLPMGTRCGALDAGVILHLLASENMSATEISDLLYHQSGLLGVSGISNDMRVLLASDDPRAREAVELFVYRISRELGSLAAALGGLDALVFTGGIGEHSAEIRARVCAAAAWLGINLDIDANGSHATRISSDDSAVSVWVIPTDEELMIARSACELAGSATGT